MRERKRRRTREGGRRPASTRSETRARYGHAREFDTIATSDRAGRLGTEEGCDLATRPWKLAPPSIASFRPGRESAARGAFAAIICANFNSAAAGTRECSRGEEEYGFDWLLQSPTGEALVPLLRLLETRENR